MSTVHSEKFFADAHTISEYSGSVVRQIVSIVFGGICFIAFFVLGEVQKRLFLESLFDSSRYDLVVTFKWLSIALALLLLITSPIILANSASKKSKLEKTYLNVLPDRVEGIHFPEGSGNSGVYFSVGYAEIENAATVSGVYPNFNVLITLRNPYGMSGSIVAPGNVIKVYAIKNYINAVNFIKDNLDDFRRSADGYSAVSPSTTAYGTGFAGHMTSMSSAMNSSYGTASENTGMVHNSYGATAANPEAVHNSYGATAATPGAVHSGYSTAARNTAYSVSGGSRMISTFRKSGDGSRIIREKRELVCIHCGAKVGNYDTFCTNCGNAVK